MSFWKKWWKKKNKDKKGAEYEDAPLPTETMFEGDLEKRVRARRNNLSVSRSGRYKAKNKERLQLSEDLYNANGEQDADGMKKQHGHTHNNSQHPSQKGGVAIQPALVPVQPVN